MRHAWRLAPGELKIERCTRSGCICERLQMGRGFKYRSYTKCDWQTEAPECAKSNVELKLISDMSELTVDRRASGAYAKQMHKMTSGRRMA